VSHPAGDAGHAGGAQLRADIGCFINTFGEYPVTTVTAG
jgi:hypothetical protein